MSSNPVHTLKSFEMELKGLDNMIASMGGLVEMQLANVIDSLARRDVKKASLLVQEDKKIDAMETDLAQRTMHILALRQPVADDLRCVIAALKVSSILERIGDYSKNIAKRTLPLSEIPPLEATRTVIHMGYVTQTMIKDALDAYIARDIEKAEQVRLKDEDVDHMYSTLFRELLTYTMENPKHITPSVHLLFIAKNIERIGDHTTNVAENVYFLVDGTVPEDNRPKDDKSNYMMVHYGREDSVGPDGKE